MKEESNLEAAPLRYAGIATLLRRPLVNDPSGVDIALIGVPYDGAIQNRPGPHHGPREIRNMSSFTRSIHHMTRVNPYELCNIADLGDVNLSNPFDLQQCFADIRDFSKVTLGRCQILRFEDHLADDLNQCAGSSDLSKRIEGWVDKKRGK